MSSHATQTRTPSRTTTKTTPLQASATPFKPCNQNTCITATMTCYFWYHRSGRCTNLRCKYAHYCAPGMRIAEKPQRVPGFDRAVAGHNLAAAMQQAQARAAQEQQQAQSQVRAAREQQQQQAQVAQVEEQEGQHMTGIDRLFQNLFPGLSRPPRVQFRTDDGIGDLRIRLREMLREYQARVKGAVGDIKKTD